MVITHIYLKTLSWKYLNRCLDLNACPLPLTLILQLKTRSLLPFMLRKCPLHTSMQNKALIRPKFCIHPEHILKIKRRQKTIFKTVHFSSLAQTRLALADDCFSFLPPSANTSTHLRKSCYFLRPFRSASPGTEISALIEYFTPYKILRAISGQRREVYFGLLFFFFPPSFSLTPHINIYPIFQLRAAGTGTAGWAQSRVFYVFN